MTENGGWNRGLHSLVLQKRYATGMQQNWNLRLVKKVLFFNEKWCPDSESNQGHEDFQSSALPTELSGRLNGVGLLCRGAY